MFLLLLNIECQVTFPLLCKTPRLLIVIKYKLHLSQRENHMLSTKYNVGILKTARTKMYVKGTPERSQAESTR